jgi:hypothetical protein
VGDIVGELQPENGEVSSRTITRLCNLMHSWLVEHFLYFFFLYIYNW